MPAHVTVLVPFVRSAGDEVTAEVGRLQAEIASFPVTFSRVERFEDGTIYLAPERPEPFDALTEEVVARFPGYPPYGGALASLTPHLTVASGVDLAEISARLAPSLPWHGDADRVELVERGADLRWRTRAAWRLAPASLTR